MKGLVVWAHSACRSQMALYRALGQELDVPMVVPLWQCGENELRAAVGFCSSEFSDMNMVPVGEDYARGLEVIDSHKGWCHLFCVYQRSRNYRRLLLKVASRGEHVAVASEAPCNMSTGWRRLAKELYFRTKLPSTVKDVVDKAEFFINYSGNDDKAAQLIGWPKAKIIPFGYFPPPIPQSKCCLRETNHPFEILATGIMAWHRGCDVLVEALRILSERGVIYHATITQKGPLLPELKSKAERYGLPIDFTGFMPMDDLLKAYESCSVYVGSGRHEPWGMRLNDALNCGAPLVVSRGMGGVKMIDDYGCGLAYKNEDSLDLANQLERLANDMSLYNLCAQNAIRAADECSPLNKARELVCVFRDRMWI